MLSKVGLARLECPSCARTSYVSPRGLLHAATVACSYCYEPIAVADIEANDPGLSRILIILRQLGEARAAHKKRAEDGMAAGEAVSPAVSVEAQLA